MTEENAGRGNAVATGEELVSAIVPAFNAEATLAATLASMRNQTHAALEILVIDDGSTDSTSVIAHEAANLDPRLRLIRQPNAGVASARNAGIAVARGAFVAPVDADDLWHPKKLELQLAVARRAGEGLGFVYSWSRRIDANGFVLADLGAPRLRGDVFRHLVVSNFIRNASNALIPTRRLRDIGGFDPGLRAAGAQGAEDLKAFLALAETGCVEVVPAFLVGYRQSGSSMSRAALGMRRSIELVIEEVARRRPDLPEGLFRLARLNYDLYAADLALQRKDAGESLRLLGAALRRDARVAFGLLTAAVHDRASFSIGRRRRGAKFLDLDPEEFILSAGAMNRVDDLLEAATRRALARAANPPA